jgi:hypothetical protein
MMIDERTAVGIERGGAAVSSPSAAASSKPTNIKMANSSPSKIDPVPATVDGLNTLAVFPLGPPSTMTATASTANGTSDSMTNINCIRTETCTPTRLTPTTVPSTASAATHHGGSMPKWSAQNALSRTPPRIGMPAPSAMAPAWYTPVANTAA